MNMVHFPVKNEILFYGPQVYNCEPGIKKFKKNFKNFTFLAHLRYYGPGYYGGSDIGAKQGEKWLGDQFW